ncbi:MAG: type II toxin-antitoxin system VapC family toxin [Chloroflexi bacterium]|nr:type II toxin-antitoxin system VapC family toxin [Chloroflexota bacterium]
MSLVCFDNNVLIWGIKEQAELGQEEMIPRAKALINDLVKSKTEVIIPSLVIAEFLMRIHPKEHTTTINLFELRFALQPFDTAAASKFAEIWQTRKSEGIIKALIESGKTKTEMRVDNLIVAIAVAQKAECIYSHDDDLKAFARGFIEVRDIPPVPSTPFVPKQINAFPAESTNQDWGKSPKMNEPTVPPDF